MSKLGNRPIALPTGVTVEVNNGEVVVKGSKGELRTALPQGITVNIVENEVIVARPKDNRTLSAKHGLIRSLVNNMIIGVSTGFTKRLQLIGTGYRVAKKGTGLTLSVGFSHPVVVEAVPGVNLDIDGNALIIVSGADKHMVGQVAANIRRIRPPEPYKGKGIRYEDEQVRRKQGKAVAK